MRPTNALLVFAALLVAGAAHAQVVLPGDDIQASGVSYIVYTEPGAPTVEITVVGEGVRSGIYRLQEGTTLTQLVALSGGVPTSEEGERQIVTSFIRVLREQGGVRNVIYEATTEQAIREPGSHPPFRDGDLVELDITYEEVRPPVRFIDVVNTVSRVASIVSVALLIFTRVDRL
ncbi:MAG: hypothetical protein AAF845_00490 [Bacteroidota bacterium]